METNEKKNEMCDVCESEPADVICQECNKMHAFCKCCFDLSHRSPKKKTHVPKPLKTELLKLSSDLSLQMYKCSLHPLEGLKYVCVQCKTVACADCFAIGNHRNHTPKGFEDSAQEILARFVDELEDAKRVSIKAKDIHGNVTKEKEKDILAFTTFTTSVKEQFKALHDALDKKMEVLLGAVQAESEGIMKYLGDSEKNSADISTRLGHRVKYLKETIEHIRKTINPDNYSQYKELVPENLHRLSEGTLDEVKAILAAREKLRTPPALNMDQVFAAIAGLDFAPNKSIKTDCTYDDSTQELKIQLKIPGVDYSGIKARAVDLQRQKQIGEETVTNNKITYHNYLLNKDYNKCRIFLGLPWNFLDCEIYKPAVQFSAITRFNLKTTIPVESFTMVTKDCVTGAYYLANTFNSCRNLHEYQSLSDFMKGKSKRVIHLEQPFDGWYIAVKGGHAYYNLSGTNKILIAELGSGKARGTCSVPYASCRNGPGTFSHRGYTDLAVFCDERTEKVYVAYETQDEQEFKIAEIVENDKYVPRLAGTWVVKGERKGNYAFGFMYNNMMYLGSSHRDLAIDRQFSLLEGKLTSTGVIQAITPTTAIDVHFVTFLPADKAMICCMSEPYRICVFDAEI